MKKFLSALLLLTILISCLPMAFADGETVIPISATERTVIGRDSGSQEATYSLMDCHGSSFTFGAPNDYNYYEVPYRSLFDYKVSVAESGFYSITMNMSGFYQQGYVMDVYVDECAVLRKELPPCTSGTDVTIGGISLTAGEHTIGFRVDRFEYAQSIRLRTIYFEKTGGLQKVAFRAASYKNATAEGTTQPVAATYSVFGGNYSNYTSYGQSHLWTNGGAVLEYDLGLSAGGTYTLFAYTRKGSGAISVSTGASLETAQNKISSFMVSNAPEWENGDEKALIKVGEFEIAAGEKLFLQFTRAQQNLYFFELTNFTSSALLDEINAATDPTAVKDIFASYGGYPAEDINNKLSRMFFTGFIGAELIGQGFADMESLLAAFDAAYAREENAPNIQLLAVSYGNLSLPGIEKNSDYRLKIKKNVLEPGTAVLIAVYKDNGSLKKVAKGVAKADEDLTVGDVWINPGNQYKIFFLDSLATLQPLNIFN